MEAKAENILAKLRRADSRKIARWLTDRGRNALRKCAVEARRLQFRLYDTCRRAPRLPPGSLSASCERQVVSDDRFYMKQFARHGQVFKLFWGSGELKTCVIGFPLARRLLNEHRGKLRLVNMQDISSLVPAEYLRSMDPAIHPHYRRLFIGAFRGDLVAPSIGPLHDMLRGELDRLAAASTSATPAPRRLYETLDTIVLNALLLLMLGVDPASPSAQALRDAYRRLGPHGRVMRAGPPQVAAFREIHACVIDILHSMRADSAVGYADSVLRRLAHHAPAAEIDDTVIGNAIYLVERGRHDLRDLLRWVLMYVSGDAETIAALREGTAESPATAKLAEACVLETLRLDQAEQLNRRTQAAFSFGGFHFPAQSWVSIMIRESHRDPATFADPDLFRPQRFVRHNYSADQYAPFGIDEHQCVAASLVVRLAALFLVELVRGFDWTVTGNGPRRFGELHWEPPEDFAIELRHR